MNKQVSRKSFLKKILMVAVAPVLLLSNAFSMRKETGTVPSGALPGSDCGATDRATAGPFYINHAPTTHNINYKKLPGKAMMIYGTVYGGPDMKTPLASAKVEIWHADDDGSYHPEERGNISEFNPETINLRGIQITDKHGRYTFESIVPGLYGNRRRHIHWKIVADGHVPLTTQSYWLDEKGNSREKKDGTDRNTEECRYMDFRKSESNIMEGAFDIYLAKE